MKLISTILNPILVSFVVSQEPEGYTPSFADISGVILRQELHLILGHHTLLLSTETGSTYPSNYPNSYTKSDSTFYYLIDGVVPPPEKINPLNIQYHEKKSFYHLYHFVFNL
ncbi:MAG: hypothetical protein ACERKD_08050 [Prolixibacteraceae bacterium]